MSKFDKKRGRPNQPFFFHFFFLFYKFLQQHSTNLKQNATTPNFKYVQKIGGEIASKMSLPFTNRTQQKTKIWKNMIKIIKIFQFQNKKNGEGRGQQIFSNFFNQIGGKDEYHTTQNLNGVGAQLLFFDFFLIILFQNFENKISSKG